MQVLARIALTRRVHSGVISGPITNGAAQLGAQLSTVVAMALDPLNNQVLNGLLSPLLDPIENTVLPTLLGPIIDAIDGGLPSGTGSGGGAMLTTSARCNDLERT